MTKRRFELVEGSTAKFWEIEEREHELVIGWGRLGTAGQSQTKSFAGAAEATTAAEKLVREKTGKGYVAVGAASAPAASVEASAGALVYVVADFDVRDDYRFSVRDDGDALVVGTEGAGCRAERRIEADVLESAPGVWVLAQGDTTPEPWCPPCLVSRSVHAALAGTGAVELRTGFSPDRVLTFSRTPKSELSDDAQAAVRGWKLPMLVARTDDGDELVVADDVRPQLLYLRVDDACTVEWTRGILAKGEKPKVTKPKKVAGEKKLSPAEVLASSAPASERRAAAKKLGKSATDEAIAALGAALLEPDVELRLVIGRAFSDAVVARRNGGQPYDVVPIFRTLVERAEDVEDGTREADDAYSFTPMASALGCVGNFLHDHRERPEVISLLRELAWKRRLAGSTYFARSLLVSARDPEALDRVSWMLAHHALDTTAVTAIFALPPDVAIPRAKEQLAAASPAERQALATRLAQRARRSAGVAWLDVLDGLRDVVHPNALRELGDWAKAHHAELPPGDVRVARLLSLEFRWDDEVIAWLAAYPTDALGPEVVRRALDEMPRSEAILHAASPAALAAALGPLIDDDQWFPMEPAETLLVARAKEPVVRERLGQLAARYERNGARDPYQAERAAELRAAIA